MAFFPCIYFCENNNLYFTGKHANLQNMDAQQRADNLIERSRNRQYLYELILKMFTICDQRGIRLIVENPYQTQHFLHNNFPYSPSVIDKNRALRGDHFVKPTQYWFVNCTNTEGCTLCGTSKVRAIDSCSPGVKAGICSEERSMISPDYACNFICDFILGKEQINTQLTLF